MSGDFFLMIAFFLGFVAVMTWGATAPFMPTKPPEPKGPGKAKRAPSPVRVEVRSEG